MNDEPGRDHEPFVMTERPQQGGIPADDLEEWERTLRESGFSDAEVELFLRTHSAEYDRAHPPPIDEFIERELACIIESLQREQGTERTLTEEAEAHVRKYLAERYRAIYGK